jgi:hypothetical protein
VYRFVAYTAEHKVVYRYEVYQEETREHHEDSRIVKKLFSVLFRERSDFTRRYGGSEKMAMNENSTRKTERYKRNIG